MGQKSFYVNNALQSNVKHLVFTLLIITTSQRKKFRKDGLHLKNSGKSIIIKKFVQSLDSNHFFIKATESSDSVLIFER